MLTKEITYDDFDGTSVKRTFYFNLTREELIDFDLGYEGGIEQYFADISSSDDNRNTYRLFKNLILRSYGVRSPEGLFYKNEVQTAGFAATEAFSELILSFLDDAKSAAMFVEGLLPPRLVAEAKAAQENASEQTVPGTVVGTSYEGIPVENAPAPVAPQVRDIPAWEAEDRDPSQRELMNMSQEELRAAFQRKNSGGLPPGVSNNRS